MLKVDRTPENLNFLSPRAFSLIIHRAPHLNFFVQGVSLPSISLDYVTHPNMFSPIPLHGDSIEFGELVVRFKIDEDLRNYAEMFDWLMGSGYPESWKQHGDLDAHDKNGNMGYGKYSDITLNMQTNLTNYNFNFTFIDALPVGIGPVDFQYNVGDITYNDATMTFKYQRFVIERPDTRFD